MASLMSPPYFSVGAGLTAADGAKLYFYVVGSGTLKDTHTTAAATVAHANPVIADAKGVFDAIYLSGDYDWVLKDKNDVQRNSGSVSEFATASSTPADAESTYTAATVAAIQAATLTGYASVQTLGYTTAGDGGGALYRADTGDTSSADDGFLVIVSNDLVRFKLVNNGELDVKWAGAQTAASAAVNATAIQKVLDYTNPNRLVCWLSPAAYSISTGLTATGNDVVILGASMETVSLDATSAVTGPILDINPGGSSRYSRGHIAEMKLTGAQISAANWYDSTYYATHGIRVDNVVNGLTIQRVRVVRTTTSGIELFSTTAGSAGCWFNTIKDCFIENCLGSGYHLKANSNGVNIDACISYLCEVGMTISDSFAVNISGCGIEDTRGNGLRISGESVVSVTGTWFEDHGLGTVTDGAIDISGVVADTARPATVSVDGCFFNSVGDYVVKGENAKITVHGSRSDGSTINIFNLDANCTLDDGESNFWVFSGVQYEGAGFPTALVNYDGTWTPVISDAATAGNTATFDANAASQKYSKRGKLITLQARLENIDTTGMTAGNILFVQGLPIAASSTDYHTGACELSEITISGAYVVPKVQGSGSTTAMYLTDINTAATRTTIKVSDVTAATADVFITLTYSTA